MRKLIGALAIFLSVVAWTAEAVADHRHLPQAQQIPAYPVPPVPVAPPLVPAAPPLPYTPYPSYTAPPAWQTPLPMEPGAPPVPFTPLFPETRRRLRGSP